MSCKGAYFYCPKALTVVDIGGQDNKVIRINEKGQTIDFKMNRKCAAGTGTFIEEIAIKTAIPLDKLDELARKSQKKVKIGSYCTVFRFDRNFVPHQIRRQGRRPCQRHIRIGGGPCYGNDSARRYNLTLRRRRRLFPHRC